MNCIGGIALTEPNCGTDLQSIRTRAAKDGDDYIINGTKTWISNGIHAHVMAILTKTDWEIEPRHRGISLFLVEKGEGFRASKKLEKLGYKVNSAELLLEDCRVPADQLIGMDPGNGFKQIMGGLELGRINVAARGCGVCIGITRRGCRVLAAARNIRPADCQPSGHSIETCPAWSQKVEATQLLTYRAAEAYDRGERCDMEAGMAKLFATEAAIDNFMDAMRVHGGWLFEGIPGRTVLPRRPASHHRRGYE